jgi:hypothetical protein
MGSGLLGFSLEGCTLGRWLFGGVLRVLLVQLLLGFRYFHLNDVIK